MFDKDNNIGSPWIDLHFNSKELAYLTENYNALEYKVDENIVDRLEKNNYIYMVKKGKVQIIIDNVNGDFKSVLFAGPGNMITEVSAILNKSSYVYAIALTDCSVYKIPIEEIKERLSQNLDIYWKFVEQIALKSNIMLNQISMLTFDNPESRVKKILFWLFSSWGDAYNEGILLSKKNENVNLTHQKIADITGLSRVSVSNVFLQLYEENKLVKLEEGYYIHDPE